MFKDDDNGATSNIYISWLDMITDKEEFRWQPNHLGDFSDQELHHLKWLIEQQINVLMAQTPAGSNP